jgi:hypothetical protein
LSPVNGRVFPAAAVEELGASPGVLEALDVAGAAEFDESPPVAALLAEPLLDEAAGAGEGELVGGPETVVPVSGSMYC